MFGKWRHSVKWRRAILTILYLVCAAPALVAGGGNPALASEGATDSLLVMPTAVSGSGDDHDRLRARLEFAAGAALMDVGILPVDPDFVTVPADSGTSADIALETRQARLLAILKTMAARDDNRLIVVEIDLLASGLSGSQPVPAASATDVGTGRLIGRTSTLPLLEPESDMAIMAAAAALMRSLARQLEQNGYVLSAASQKPWGGRATQYRLSLEGFDLCERRELLTTIENEFPGFLSLDLVKAPNPTFAVYLYTSTATGQRLQKWLEQMMISYGTFADPASRILVNDDSIRIQKDRKVRIYSPLCDG